MTKEEHDKIIHLMEHGALHGIDTGRLDSKCEVVIPLEDAVAIIDSIDKTGHWINAKVGKLFPSNDFKCSECGNILDFNGVNCGRGSANYCPNCGTRMESNE